MADRNYSKYAALSDYFRENLSYRPATGSVVWSDLAVKNTACKRPGAEVGCKTKDGYRQACIKNVSIYLHVVAWYLHHGKWPLGVVDHINGDRSDNRIDNLRVVSHAENIQNQRRANKRNKLSALGCSLAENGRFRSAIRFSGKTYCLGTFDTVEEAHSAYIAKKRELHPGCTL